MTVITWIAFNILPPVLLFIAGGVFGLFVGTRRFTATMTELAAASKQRQAEQDAFHAEVREKLQEIARLAVSDDPA